MIICNAHSIDKAMTGVQRYVREMLAHMPPSMIRVVTPPKHLNSVGRALWEQAVLPLQLNGKLLWSPSNVGPYAVKNQIVTVHDAATTDYKEDFSLVFSSYYDFMFRKLLPRTRGVIAVSAFTRSRLIDIYGLDESRVRAIHNGVDHDRFKPQSADAVAELRTRLNLPERYVLYLGTISPRKNLKALVDAWRLAQGQVDSDVELIIAGAAGASLLFKNSDLGELPSRTRLVGRVSDQDLPVILTGAQMFVFPSLYEGFGFPPLEAMACGAPVIVSDATSLPEVVGSAGRIFDASRTEDLAQEIINVSNSSALQAEMRQAGIARAALFTWRKTADETLAFLGA